MSKKTLLDRQRKQITILNNMNRFIQPNDRTTPKHAKNNSRGTREQQSIINGRQKIRLSKTEKIIQSMKI